MSCYDINNNIHIVSMFFSSIWPYVKKIEHNGGHKNRNPHESIWIQNNRNFSGCTLSVLRVWVNTCQNYINNCNQLKIGWTSDSCYTSLIHAEVMVWHGPRCTRTRCVRCVRWVQFATDSTTSGCWSPRIGWLFRSSQPWWQWRNSRRRCWMEILHGSRWSRMLMNIRQILYIHVQVRLIWERGLSCCSSRFTWDLPGFPNTSALAPARTLAFVTAFFGA